MTVHEHHVERKGWSNWWHANEHRVCNAVYTDAAISDWPLADKQWISDMLAAWLKRVIEVRREWDDKKEKIGTDRLFSFISISRGEEVWEQWKPERSYLWVGYLPEDGLEPVQWLVICVIYHSFVLNKKDSEHV